MTSATLNGDNMKFSVNDTGIFITSNGHEAQVVGSDYIAYAFECLQGLLAWMLTLFVQL